MAVLRPAPHTPHSPTSLLLLTVLLHAVILVVCARHPDQQLRYDGHKVYRVLPKTEEQRTRLKEYLHRTPEADVWKEGTSLEEPVDIRVPPHHVTSFQNHFQTHDIPHDTFIEDVQEGIERSKRSVDATHELQKHDFSKYLNHTQIMEWLILKKQECGSMCTLIPIGNSTENRTLVVIKIGRPGFNKRKLWVDAGIHAREWISPATAMFFIEKLISQYKTNRIVQTMVDEFDWYILPIINPDGYEYTWTDDRLWRKTRSQDPETGCYGVDANRNFDYKWRSNLNDLRAWVPCSNTYAGSAAFSEPEAAAVARAVLALKGQEGVDPGVHLYLTLHSYSQLWMAPWGWTKHYPRTIEDLMDVGSIAVEALRAVHGTNYTLGPASSILYESSGTSRDWAYGNGIQYVYTVELRDKGTYGFLLPEDQILPCVEEAWAGVEAMVCSFSRKCSLRKRAWILRR